jgi:hypothetical protein
MDKDKLKEKIDEGFSTYDLAKHFNSSQTNIRYWLRKFGINTNHFGAASGCRNGKLCLFCSQDLTGKKMKFCSSKCKTDWNYANGTEENPNTLQRQKRVSKERKLALIEMMGGGCSICGYNKNLAALSFHHRSPENKTFNLDSRKLSNTRMESILEEVKKCDLVCCNCHAEIHNPDLTLK